MPTPSTRSPSYESLRSTKCWVLTECTTSHARCWISKSPSHSLIQDQMCTEKRHLNRRWTADSCTWLQSLDRPQFCHPLRLSLSAVHTRFCIINQENILQFGGAHDFETNIGIAASLMRFAPENCIYKPRMPSRYHLCQTSQISCSYYLGWVVHSRSSPIAWRIE
jgi:hypothetical protein